MRRIINIILGAVATVIAAPLIASAVMVGADPDNPIAIRGCVIRYDTKNAAGTAVVPHIFEDANHYCVGVTSVTLDGNGDLLINNAGGPGRVVYATAHPDESLAALGLDCGISGGGSVSLVRCYDRNGQRVRHDSLTMYGAGNNLWFAAANYMP